VKKVNIPHHKVAASLAAELAGSKIDSGALQALVKREMIMSRKTVKLGFNSELKDR
jgi:hypothetical protein